MTLFNKMEKMEIPIKNILLTGITVEEEKKIEFSLLDMVSIQLDARIMTTKGANVYIDSVKAIIKE